MKVGNILNI
jgi:hypothetical protein